MQSNSEIAGNTPRVATPRTEEGKRLSSLSAVQNALTGRTVLLAGDDAAAYAEHIEKHRAYYQPVGLRETELVQSLADTHWRLQRIVGLEHAIYAKGRREFADDYADFDLATRTHLINLDVHLKYEKQLYKLHIQESRLGRRMSKDLGDLAEVQHRRQSRERAVQQAAARAAQPTATPTREFVFQIRLNSQNHPNQ